MDSLYNKKLLSGSTSESWARGMAKIISKRWVTHFTDKKYQYKWYFAEMKLNEENEWFPLSVHFGL